MFWGAETQAETVADDDTQDWLANVMSNTVAARRPSLGGPAGAQGGGGPPAAAGASPRSPRQRAADRVARKTLIIKSGAADAVEHEASGAPLCMRAPVHACSLCALRRPKCSRQGKTSWTTNRGGTAQERCVVLYMLFIPVRSEVQKHRSLPPDLCAFTRTKSVQCVQYARVFIPSEVGGARLVCVGAARLIWPPDPCAAHRMMRRTRCRRTRSRRCGCGAASPRATRTCWTPGTSTSSSTPRSSSSPTSRSCSCTWASPRRTCAPRRLHPDSVTARCHCHNHVLKKAVVISPMYRGVR